MRQESGALPTFQEWVIGKCRTGFVHDPSQQTQRIAVKVQLDDHWPTGDASLCDIMKYLNGQKCPGNVRCEVLMLWSTYVVENHQKVTLRHIRQIPKFTEELVRYLPLDDRRKLLQQVAEEVSRMEQLYFGGNFGGGVRWDGEL